MNRPRKFDIPDLNPDFRTMTEKDLRRDMTRINRCLREMNKDSDRYFHEIDDLRGLRKRYKKVWRARPGRVFHDVATRKRREHERRRGDPYIFPFGL